MKSIIATLRIHPDRVPEVENVLRAMVRHSETETGTVVYEFVKPDDEPHTLIVYERYRNAAAKELHLGSAQLADAFKQVGPLLAAPVELRHAETLDWLGCKN